MYELTFMSLSSLYQVKVQPLSRCRVEYVEEGQLENKTILKNVCITDHIHFFFFFIPIGTVIHLISRSICFKLHIWQSDDQFYNESPLKNRSNFQLVKLKGAGAIVQNSDFCFIWTIITPKMLI